MIKHIVLFGAGKSATCLISYLLKVCRVNNWHLTVADHKLPLAESKVGKSLNARATQIQAENEEERSGLIKESDLVISLLPPSLHFLVATDCLLYGKDLITASYLDENIKALEPAIIKKGLLFLCEMGLDPGLDHMSALRLIHQIKLQGGNIVSFKSHCGGLVAPQSDDNPWHYKISWNPGNVVRAGSTGALYREGNTLNNVSYEQLFSSCKEVAIKNLGNLAYYPNRDSLIYEKLYDLESAATFIRTTLRYPEFCSGWKYLVQAGLTNDSDNIDTGNLTFKKWAEKIQPLINPENKRQFEFLGLLNDIQIPVALNNSAAILQYLLEKKLMMQPSDKDLVVMLHEIEFVRNNKHHKMESLLMLEGENNMKTAMAKTVGLPLGIAATLVLQGKIFLRGLHLPILPEIYLPVLQELELEGIRFDEKIV